VSFYLLILSVCLSVCLPACLSVSVSLCLCVSVSLCLCVYVTVLQRDCLEQVGLGLFDFVADALGGRSSRCWVGAVAFVPPTVVRCSLLTATLACACPVQFSYY
jgi:hypothetical protein